MMLQCLALFLDSLLEETLENRPAGPWLDSPACTGRRDGRDLASKLLNDSEQQLRVVLAVCGVVVGRPGVV